MMAGFMVSVPVLRQDVTVEGYGDTELLPFLRPGSREEGKNHADDMPLKGTLQVTYLFQPGPTLPVIPKSIGINPLMNSEPP